MGKSIRELRCAGMICALVVIFVVFGAGCDRNQNSGLIVDESASQQAGSSGTQQNAYQVKLEKSSVNKGVPDAVNVMFTPGKGLKINKEFPWRVEFQTTDGISLPVDSFSKNDILLEDAHAKVPLLVHALKDGELEIKAVADFSVCNDDRCDIIRGQELQFTLQSVSPE